MPLRDYQQEATDAGIRNLRRSLDPIVIAAATGSGKSHIIAALAEEMHKLSGGKGILCLAPSKELVLQNAEKYWATGAHASIFCASAGEKCLAHPVVFGSPVSVKNSVGRFAGRVSTVVVDEAHGITPTVIGLVEKLRDGNPMLRVVGLTATPYRLGSGYIYRQDADGRAFDERFAKEPYFSRCVYRVGAYELIERGFLTPPAIGRAEAGAYDTSGLELSRMGKYTAESVEKAFVGHGRLTSKIVADIVEQAHDRQGVLLFASTVPHAEECLASLPPENSALVTGKTPAGERRDLLERFKARKLKYLVNVSVLTTGFDAPHIDLIAVLRATESVTLLQQIVGRGLRISEGKRDCLILDYAGNLQVHCPDGDLFNPRIEAHRGEGCEPIEVLCPQCRTKNVFALNEAGKTYTMDRFGYCVDLTGNRMIDDAGHGLAGHHGRRCQHRDIAGGQCDHRWSWRDCPKCGGKSDIAARSCEHCSEELVDPNEKLNLEVKPVVAPTEMQTERVLAYRKKDTSSKKGNRLCVVYFTTPSRTFPVFFHPYSQAEKAQEAYLRFFRADIEGKIKTIRYKKNQRGYYNAYGYNE